MRIIRLRRRRIADEAGSMLIELLMAMFFLAVAVGALISVYASTQISLRHASIEGNALTMVDKQMESLKTVPFASIKLDASTLPASSDLYVTSPPSNLTSSQASSITGGQVTGGSFAATQTVTGPDNRIYRVDTYLFSTTPSGGEPVVQVTVDARLVTGGAVGSISASSTSALDLASTQAPS
jgi:Tfp pilus assembly protein PilV